MGNKGSNLRKSSLNRIVIVARRFADGEAANNRLLSYAKGFGEAGREVHLYYCITRPDRAKFVGAYPGVVIHYLWEEQPGWLVRRKLLSFMVSVVQLFWRISRRDTVFTNYREIPLFYAVCLLSKRLYCETTEHPFFSGNGSTAKRLEFKLCLAFGRRLKGLFVISESLRKYYAEHGFSPDKLHIINMFVDTDRFKGPFPAPTEAYIAYCGTVSKFKDGVDCLIRAFALLRQRCTRYKLYIIGSAESRQEYEELRQLARELGVGDATVFTGKVPAVQMPELLTGAEMLVLARPDNIQARNGFPTKLGEYLATGKPVVVTRVGEIGNFLRDGRDCLLSEPGDPEAFAQKMLWVAEHPEQAVEIGKRGRELAFSEFSYRTQTRKALDIMKRDNN